MIDQPENPPAIKTHSRLGIASVLIGGLLPFVLISLLVLGMVLGSKKGSPGAIFGLGFIIVGLAGPLIHLVGFGLGLGGFISKKTKKLYPWIGTILNLVLGIIGVFIIYFVISNLSFGFH